MRVISLRKRDATLSKQRNSNNSSIFSISNLRFCPKNETHPMCQIRLFGSQRCLPWHTRLSALHSKLGDFIAWLACCPRPAGRIGQVLPFLVFEPPEPSHCSERRKNPREMLLREISRGAGPKGLIGRYRLDVSEREMKTRLWIDEARLASVNQKARKPLFACCRQIS